jgi:hypothetical protein
MTAVIAAGVDEFRSRIRSTRAPLACPSLIEEALIAEKAR